jgi:hypothetical protein
LETSVRNLGTKKEKIKKEKNTVKNNKK